MADLDRVIVEEWIEELEATQLALRTAEITGAALKELRAEILAYLERAKQTAFVHLPADATFGVH